LACTDFPRAANCVRNAHGFIQDGNNDGDLHHMLTEYPCVQSGHSAPSTADCPSIKALIESLSIRIGEIDVNDRPDTP
jgi:hypothetical protein